MIDLSRCTPEEIHASHGAALGAEDLDAIVANYAPDAVFIGAGSGT
jgi:ketosteroid isomerase-like protein